jgi:hypothetical protein
MEIMGVYCEVWTLCLNMCFIEINRDNSNLSLLWAFYKYDWPRRGKVVAAVMSLVAPAGLFSIC